MALDLARLGGWVPLGTSPPSNWSPKRANGTDRQWNSQDYTKRGALVSDQDAGAIASAVDRVMDDVPSHDAVGHKVVSSLEFPFGKPLRMLNPFEEVSPLEYFSGDGKVRLARFVAFCRKGGFQIT